MADSSTPRPGFQPRSPVTLDDLAAGLVWPKLLRTARLALRPARVGFGAFFLIGCALLLGVADWLDGQPGNILHECGLRIAADARGLLGAIWDARWNEAYEHAVAIFIRAPWGCVRQAPWATVIIAPLLLIWTVVIGGAISRTAATELAWSRTTGWPDALALSIRRWRSLVGAVAIPLGAIWIVTLIMAVAGAALFRVQVVSVIAAVGWGFFLLGGVFVSVMMLGVWLGHWLLVPAVMCEGADSIDAVQHAFAMSFARPLRLVLYAILLTVQGVLLGTVVAMVMGTGLIVAQLAASKWSGDRGAAIIGTSSIISVAESLMPASSPPTNKAAAGLVRAWNTIFVVIGFGAAVSYAWCAATGLFLVMRRVCDGQEMSELWSPGMIEGTTTESLQARSARGAPPPPPPPQAVVGPSAPQAIVDNGPADEG